MRLTLSSYVKKRNGVPLGAAGSMSNMLKRSLGANTFAAFWQYWNPIWGYYLARWVFVPVKRYCPPRLAVLVTFIVSGALHDAAIVFFHHKLVLFCTPWFGIMGMWVIVSSSAGVKFSGFSWYARALCNLGFILGSLTIVLWIKRYYPMKLG